jgi:maleylacetoacetate isomerase
MKRNADTMETGREKKDEEQEIVLYSYFRSSCSWRVRIALNLKKIPHKISPVNLVAKEQTSEEYLKKNPLGVVPALTIDGHTLTQSNSILEYLEETRSDRFPLLPRNPHERSLVRSIAMMIVADTQPLHNLRVINHVSSDMAKKKEWINHWCTLTTTALEKVLATTAGKYCVGDSITLADVCLVPHMYTLRRWEVPLDNFPICVRIDALLSQHPDFISAQPANQIDVPADQKGKV